MIFYRVLLFTSESLSEPHPPEEFSDDEDGQRRIGDEEPVECTSLYFDEPLDWMEKNMKSDIQGKVQSLVFIRFKYFFCVSHFIKKYWNFF